jgi:hypothetical protein
MTWAFDLGVYRIVPFSLHVSCAVDWELCLHVWCFARVCLLLEAERPEFVLGKGFVAVRKISGFA